MKAPGISRAVAALVLALAVPFLIGGSLGCAVSSRCDDRCKCQRKCGGDRTCYAKCVDNL